MWSFATHAGAGMAIAGLTATYYALSRRNYQGERERMAHETGFGDGPQVNRLRKHNDNDQLSSSQMLLKKELEELSLLNGSRSGLNIIYQQKSPLHRFKSNFEITPIVSRVDTRPSTIYSPSEEEIGKDTSADDDARESVFGSEPNIDKESNPSINKDIISDDLPNLPIEIEEMSVLVVQVGEKGDGDIIDEKNELDTTDNLKSNSDTNENEGESMPLGEEKQSESVAEKWEAAQEKQVLNKTPSPICFFKNPGFGSRFAVDIKKKEPTPLVARLSTSNVTNGLVADPSQKSGEKAKLSSSDHCQNSTQFILSPDLSKSNTSVCEAENPEKLLRRRKKLAPTDKLPDTRTKTIVDTNPVQEMSDYNKTLTKKINVTTNTTKGGTQPLIRRRADPERSNVKPPLKRTAKPVLVISPEVLDSNQCKKEKENNSKQNEESGKTQNEMHEKVLEDGQTSDRNNNDRIHKSKEDSGDILDESILMPTLESGMSSPCTTVESSESTRSSSILNEIPRHSWIALPVRLYTNSTRTLPWSLIGFCMMVVVIAGIFGIFLSKLAAIITHRHIQDGKL